MLINIDEVAVRSAEMLLVRAGDREAICRLRDGLNGMTAYYHVLSLDPALEYDVVTVRELCELLIIDHIVLGLDK